MDFLGNDDASIRKPTENIPLPAISRIIGIEEKRIDGEIKAYFVLEPRDGGCIWRTSDF